MRDLPFSLRPDRVRASYTRIAEGGKRKSPRCRTNAAGALTGRAALWLSRRRNQQTRQACMAVAFVFPGQGSQAVGMGAELAKAYASARTVFDEVDSALGQSLSRIMFEGPLETLTLTENAQPALMAVSLAVMRVLEGHGIRLHDRVKFVAGHSLGEYSALAAAGALSIPDAARLLRTRGRAMQEAVPVGMGAMAALLGAGKEVAEKLAAEAAQGGG